jgi:hypothetical protein
MPLHIKLAEIREDATTGLILKFFLMINSITEVIVRVWAVRAHFQLKRKSFFTQYTRQIMFQKNEQKK